MVSSNFAVYKTLRTINLKKNNITEFSQLASLPFLIELNLSSNQINSLASLNRKRPEGDETEYWPRLQYCYLNSNKIMTFTAIVAPKLLHLDLSHNEISSVPEGDEGFKGHEQLQFLDLTRNKLTTLANIRGMPNLKVLYVAGNVNIRKINGLEECQSLERLSLRGNSISAIEIQPDSFPNLKYLNLRENSISKLDEIKNLNGFKSLETLIMSFNPIVNDNKHTYIFEIMTRVAELENLKRLNKHAITLAIKQASLEWLESEKEAAYQARKKKEKEEEDKKDLDDK